MSENPRNCREHRTFPGNSFYSGTRNFHTQYGGFSGNVSNEIYIFKMHWFLRQNGVTFYISQLLANFPKFDHKIALYQYKRRPSFLDSGHVFLSPKSCLTRYCYKCVTSLFRDKLYRFQPSHTFTFFWFFIIGIFRIAYLS